MTYSVFVVCVKHETANGVKAGRPEGTPPVSAPPHFKRKPAKRGLLFWR
jgi:hypothetical protein